MSYIDEIDIDWKKVEENLKCPICGEKASINAETDGTEGSHTHRFKISREMARSLCLPTKEEAPARITELEKELEYLKQLVKEDSKEM